MTPLTAPNLEADPDNDDDENMMVAYREKGF